MGEFRSIFLTNIFEQRKTIEDLTEESRADADFYLFLAGSSIITTLGLIIDSSIVVIGGMLVAPLLFPILSFGMGMTTFSQTAILRSARTIVQSIFLVTIISLFFSFLLEGGKLTEVITLASTAGIPHFIVAFISGIVASFAWVKQTVNASLPGVAISVSLIPPLSALGIGLSLFEPHVITGALALFVLNLFGIIAASILVFTVFGFWRLQSVQNTVIKEEIEKKEAIEAQKERAKEEEQEKEGQKYPPGP